MALTSSSGGKDIEKQEGEGGGGEGRRRGKLIFFSSIIAERKHTSPGKIEISQHIFVSVIIFLLNKKIVIHLKTHAYE